MSLNRRQMLQATAALAGGASTVSRTSQADLSLKRRGDAQTHQQTEEVLA